MGDLVLAGLQLAELLGHAPQIAALPDGVEHRRVLLLDPGQLLAVRDARCAALLVEPVGLLGIRLHRLCGGLGRHQPVPEPCHDPLLDLDAPDGPAVGARCRHDVVGAAIAALAAHRVRAAARAAFEQAGEQVAGPVGGVHPVGAGVPRRRNGGGVFLRKLSLPGLGGLPKLVVHDAKLGNLGQDPLLGRVDPRDPLAGGWVLHEALPVPYQPADIELVVEQPRAALGVAAQHRVAPKPALGAGDAFVLQAPRDGARACAAGELPEDAPDDLRLRLVDFRFAPETAMRLRREVLQEQRVHGALEADMQLVDLAFACREREDYHAGEAQMLVEGRNVGLVAAH